MKYYSWRLNWEVNPTSGSLEGTDPTSIVNNENTRLEPHFASGAISDTSSTVYGYLIKGDIDLLQLASWSMQEVTKEEMLVAAKKIDPLAALVEEYISFS